MRRLLFLIAAVSSALAWAQAPAGASESDPVATAVPGSGAAGGAATSTGAPTPAAPSPAPATTVSKPTAKAPSSTVLANELGPNRRKYLIRGGIDFSTRVVNSVTPAQSRQLTYYAQGEYMLIPGGSAFVRMGLNQVFVVTEGQPAFLLQDTVLGFKYVHGLELWKLPALTFLHSARLFLPTSKISRNTGLYAAPELRSQLTMDPVRRLTLGLEMRAQYRFHRFAERGDLSEGLNTRYQLMAHPFAAYQVAKLGRFGTIEAGADLFYSWRTLYGSRETYVMPDSGPLAPASEPAPLLPSMGWDAYLSYWPVRQFAFTVSVFQNAPVLRDGIVNQDAFFDRDETQLVFGLYAQY